MADNITLNAGSGGVPLKTDELADTSHVQYVKLMNGTADATDVIQGNATNGLEVDVTRVQGTVTVDGSGVTQPVSGTVTVNAGTGPWPVTDNGGSLTVDNAGLTELAAAINVSSQMDVNIAASAATVTVDGSGVTQPVSAASLPLPSGASTAANQTTIIGHVDGIEGLLTTMDADTSSLAGCVGGTELQVDVVGSLPAGTNAIGKLSANSGVDIGDVDVTSISAGTNLIGDVGISGARTSGGTTPYRNVDVDETEDAVKASAGQVYWIHAMNLTAATLYLQLYNATVASVTVGTTTPTLTFPIPTQGDTNGAGFTLSIPNGIAFSTAITIACTTTFGGASGPAANGCMVNLGYA